MSGGVCVGESRSRIVTASDFSDSVDTTVQTINGLPTIRPNPCSSLRVSLGAGCLGLRLFVNSNLAGGYDATVGVTIDGVYHAVACPDSVGLFPLGMAIDPSSAHVVEITQGWEVGGSEGHYLYAVSATGGSMAVLPNPSVDRRMVVYGDSIAVGGCASPMSQYGWLQRLRAVYPGRIALEGSGGWSLRGDVVYGGRSVEAIAARLVALCFDATTCEIWDELGYNDWLIASAGWELEVYAEKLGQLYDAIHALKPTATIYCQRQIIAGNEARTNANGDTIEGAREAKASAATGRPWVVVVDGKAATTADRLTDGIHPDNAGHAQVAAYYATALGI